MILRLLSYVFSAAAGALWWNGYAVPGDRIVLWFTAAWMALLAWVLSEESAVRVRTERERREQELRRLRAENAELAGRVTRSVDTLAAVRMRVIHSQNRQAATNPNA